MADNDTASDSSASAESTAKHEVGFRVLAPNTITIVALCFGLTAARFAISEQWGKAVLMVVLAGILDGFDGRVARLLRAQSRFGAQLDSLSDVIAFGVAPAIIIYLWSLQHVQPFGWIAALALTVCCALRLARFNSQPDEEIKPYREAGFMMGIPAPAGAGLAMVPIYLWMVTGLDFFRSGFVVIPWTLFVASMMISAIATYSWASLKLHKAWRMFVLAAAGLAGATLAIAPWYGLLFVSAVYLGVVPFSARNYLRSKPRE